MSDDDFLSELSAMLNQRRDADAGMSDDDFLSELSAMLNQRRDADPERSYVASLQRDGLDAMLRKLNEESLETMLAARDSEHSGQNGNLIHEVADWWFHSLVLLSHFGASAEDVLNELRRREGTSGLAEKARRSSVIVIAGKPESQRTTQGVNEPAEETRRSA